MKFKLIGNEHHLIGIRVKYEGKHGDETKKIHFEGGRWYDPEEVKIHVVRDGQTVEVPIIHEELIKYLKEQKKKNPNHITFEDEEEDNTPRIFDKPIPMDDDEEEPKRKKK